MKSLISVVLICWLSLLPASCTNSIKTDVHTDQAPAAIGPYSQAILVEEHLYLSGQIPLDPATGKLVEGGIEAQIRQVMQNLQGVLNAAGYDFDNVVKTEVFLTDLAHYGTLNSIYATYFKTAPPARFVVQVDRLPKEALVEIAMTAVKIE
jgi:2-iminobutanoate/2-iminopropanoate deaminase